MKKILFIGNSFTYFNNMPFILQQLFAAAGTEVYTRMVAYGGYHLADYLDPDSSAGDEAMQALAASDWDAVVLQEQSHTPYTNRPAFIASVRTWAEKIRKTCPRALILLYQTWSYKEGSGILAETITDTDYTGFYEGLKAGYEEAAAEVGAAVIPVGTVFYRISREQPGIELFAQDNYHPSPFGRLAAAMTFYKYIIKGSPGPGADVPDPVIPVISVSGLPAADDVSVKEAAVIARVISSV